MKKILSVIFFILLIFHTWSQEIIKFPITTNPSLHNYYEIIHEAYTELGYLVMFDFVPVEIGMQGANSGKYDGDAVRIEEAEKVYTNLIQIDVVITQVFVNVYKLSENPIKLQNEGVVIAFVRGEKLTENIARDLSIPGYNVGSIEQAMQMLLEGRIDFVIETPSVMDVVIKEQELEGIVIPEEVELVSHRVYHYLHRNNEHLIPMITAKLQEMKDSGRFEK
jgi:hypothetical protein